jgi:hypothetical protein
MFRANIAVRFAPEGVRVESGQADGAGQTMLRLLIERRVLESLAVGAAHLAVMLIVASALGIAGAVV